MFEDKISIIKIHTFCHNFPFQSKIQIQVFMFMQETIINICGEMAT